MSKSKKSKVKSEMFLHSEAKVEFYKTYLERYLYILHVSSAIKKVYLLDVFCGTGIYENGKKGSPIVAYEVIKEVKNKFPKYDTEINLIINDQDGDKVEKVKEHIGKEYKHYCNLYGRSINVNELFPKLIDFFKGQDKQTRNLIFIDPYGYKDIKRDIIEDLLVNYRTEIILFLPISQMQRFTMKAMESEELMYSHLKNFIFSFFEDNHPIKQQTISSLMYIDYIKEALKFNRYYSTSYFIERDAKNYYALFFLSSNIFGFEKILEVKWKLDATQGRGYKLPKAEGLFHEMFNEEQIQNNYEYLKLRILEYIKIPKNNIELYSFVLQHEFLPKHLVKLLNVLINDNIVLVYKGTVEFKKVTNDMISYNNYKNNIEICLIKLKT